MVKDMYVIFYFGHETVSRLLSTYITVDQIRKKMPILFQIENFQLFYYSTETAEIFANESTHEYIHFPKITAF